MKRLHNMLRGLAATVTAATAITCAAQDVSYNRAVSIAADFFRANGIEAAPSAMRKAKAAETGSSGNSAYYIINADSAFAIVAGDSRVEPILAYGFDGAFDAANIAPGAADLLEGYEAYVNAVVAGSKTYTPTTLGTQLSVNFATTDYKISTLPIDGTGASGWTAAQKSTIATLIFHAGVAANMEYAADGSGTSDLNAMVGLAKYFKYKMGGIVQASSYPDIDDYLQVIIDEINAGYPMPYTGNNPTLGGHMFICDGYNTEGKLHFNFGWSGSGNGYYFITPGSLSFYQSQGALIGIRPNRDAAPHPSIYVPYADDEPALSTTATTIRREESFPIEAKRLVNTSDETLGVRFSIRILAEDGTVKEILSEGASDSNGGKGVSWSFSGNVTIPRSYSYAEGDKIAVCYSTDQGSTWQPVTGYVDGTASIDLADLYDDTLVPNLKMINYNSACPGMTLLETTTINANGVRFTIILKNLYNMSSAIFSGDINVFVCDSEGNRKFQVGGFNTSYFAAYGIRDLSLNCTIPSGSELHRGDRLMAFARIRNEEAWGFVDCEDHDKSYILIPDALCSDAGPTTETITFSTLMETYCPAHDLDFTSVDNFKVYKLVYVDHETLMLDRIYKLKAGEGALLLGVNLTAGVYTDEALLTDDASWFDDNLLVGVLVDTIVDNNEPDATNYAFGISSVETGFYVARGETVPAGHAYMRLPFPPQNAPARFSMRIGDGTTGIITVTADAPCDGVMYNLQGIPVTNPVPGIYILNGRKVLIRE